MTQRTFAPRGQQQDTPNQIKITFDHWRYDVIYQDSSIGGYGNDYHSSIAEMLDWMKEKIDKPIINTEQDLDCAYTNFSFKIIDSKTEISKYGGEILLTIEKL
jgi:hypothetical protein